MRRHRRFLGFPPLLLLAGAGLAAPLAAPQALPLFSIVAPKRMVTGPVLVQARAADPRVALVKWYVDDWAKTTPPPFDFLLDVGPVPAERRVRALALDSSRRPLYVREITLNPGERGLSLTFVSPVAGQRVAGPTAITLEALVPAGDAPAELVVEAGEQRLPLTAVAGAEGLYTAAAVLGNEPVALVARMVTKQGRRADATLVANARGVAANASALVVEQMVGVYRGSEPLLGLSPRDFLVKDETGECEVRNVELVKDTPLALGFAVDTSLSLRHNASLLADTADAFLSQVFRSTDAGFVLAFGPVISRVQGWTNDAGDLKERLRQLPEPAVIGTALHETIVKALYQFQGSQGSRALILMSDGYDYDGDVTVEDALAYARQSGVKIYALALSTRNAVGTSRVVKGERRTEWTYREDPPNLEVLRRFADATGGRVFEVRRAEDLAPAFATIERDLRTQYLVSFTSRARPRGTFHPVEVRASKGKVVTAAGYYF